MSVLCVTWKNGSVNFIRMEKPTSGQRLRTCRACGKKFEYPVKDNPATRHHCADCVVVPEETRKILERLSSRITQLERELKVIQNKPAPKPVTPG